MEVIMYIEFWTLEMKCTQYGICEEVAFKNARATIFLEVGQGKSRKSQFLRGQLNVRLEPVSSVMAASWFCGKSS
jgi:hypothetical protein